MSITIIGKISNADHWDGRRAGKTAAIDPPDHADGEPAFPTNPGRFQIKLAAIGPATPDPACCMRFSGGNRSIRQLLAPPPQAPGARQRRRGCPPK
jgi:hypothetical protein